MESTDLLAYQIEDTDGEISIVVAKKIDDAIAAWRKRFGEAYNEGYLDILKIEQLEADYALVQEGVRSNG